MASDEDDDLGQGFGECLTVVKLLKRTGSVDGIWLIEVDISVS